MCIYIGCFSWSPFNYRCVCVYMNVCVYICVCVCVYMCMCVYPSICTCVYPSICTYVCIWKCYYFKLYQLTHTISIPFSLTLPLSPLFLTQSPNLPLYPIRNECQFWLNQQRLCLTYIRMCIYKHICIYLYI
jgi:hypothetical protein